MRDRIPTTPALPPLGEWAEYTACSRRDPNWWTTLPGLPLGLHICRSHCPVMAQCRQWAHDARVGRPLMWNGVAIGGEPWGGNDANTYVTRFPESSSAGCPEEACRG